MGGERPRVRWRSTRRTSDSLTTGEAHVVAAAGTYADIYARNLGDRSRLNLPRGPNAPVEAGGLFVTPYRE